MLLWFTLLTFTKSIWQPVAVSSVFISFLEIRKFMFEMCIQKLIMGMGDIILATY
jgi:hypothetical protein